jgi:putative ABC transport system substrate-binding protein
LRWRDSTRAVRYAHRERIAQFTAQHRLPAVYEFKIFAELGGLMSYGPNMPALWRRAAYMAFKLVLNLTTARALGLTLPPPFLFQAHEVLQ